jgi:hypothetical protein
MLLSYSLKRKVNPRNRAKIAIFATEGFIIDILIIEIFVVEAPGGIPGAFSITLLYIGRSGEPPDYPAPYFE